MFVSKISVKDWMGYFLLHVLEKVLHHNLIKVQSMILNIFQMFYEACDICNPVITVKR